MGLFSSSKSSSSQRVEDSRVAADRSSVYQIRDNRGDVSLSFTDPGALALGERGLDLAGNAIAGAFDAARDAGTGAVEGLGKELVKAAIPIALIVAVAWVFKE